MKGEVDVKKFRMFTAALLSATMLYNTNTMLFASERFSDVVTNAWYASAIDFVNESGLMSGTSNTKFSPDTTANKAMLATVLYRIAGSPAVTTQNIFTDVSNESWYANAVIWATENGILEGISKNTFGSNDSVTQQQVIAALWKYAENTNQNDNEKAIAWAIENHIIDGQFAAQNSVTRAELANILFKYRNEKNEIADATTAIAENTNTTDNAVENIATNQITENTEKGIVQTKAGLLQGTNQNNILRYLGVPYAQATERFVPAGEVEAWEGVKVADSYGSISLQGSISGLNGQSDQTGTDNNCQNLNIWTPSINDGKKRPVMVWLHGGGFSTGSGNEAGYDGENLSRDGDVVVVAVNHRLNVFGHLDLSEYDQKYQYSANVGIMDIVSALQWIQQNIEQFGGDPNNVTVFGQSGGGAKILALMSSPQAKGLFHKGIVQSGATETMGVSFTSKEASKKLTENLLNILEISPENIEELQNVSVDKLQEASSQALKMTGEELKLPAALGGGYSMDWEPVVDGDFLPTSPVTENSFADAGKDIPLLIGSNLNEWSGILPAENVPEPSEELSQAIASAYPNEESLTAEQIDSTTIRLPLLKIMTHKADQNGAPVYSYVFTYGNSYHGAEIPYVFNNNPEEENLAKQISQAWINFAKTGIPSAEGLPEWEAYTRDGGATMILDTESEVVHHHDKELMKLFAPDYEY